MNDDPDEESGLLLPSEGLATPSTKPPVSGKSARDTLSRIKSKRAELSRNKSMEPSASASSISSNPVDQSIERRRVLQRIKNNEKNRASTDSLDLTMTTAAAAAGRDSNNQGPRSPLKSLVRKSAAQSMRSSRRSLTSDAEGGEEEEEDGEEGRSDDEDEEEQEYRPILCSRDPEPAFPLSFFPPIIHIEEGLQLGLENELQHVVWTPAGAAPSAVVCCSSLPPLGGAQTDEIGTSSMMFKERDFIEMDWNHELTRWVGSQSVDSQELRAFHDQLMDRETAAISSSSTTTTSAASSAAAAASDRRDGIYRPAVPPLAKMLLEGESVPREIAKFSAPNLDLSRVTQRLLRDVKGSIESGNTRRLWQSMVADPTHQHPSDVRPAVPGEVHLLKCLSNAPMLRVIEDPTIGTSAQPLFPAAAVSYGGQIGHWSAEASSSDRVGALPKGWSARRGGGGGGGQRATFRLHLHQLMLTDHPLMSAEERRLADLKIVYAQYRALFEQKTLEYLTQRLLALITELASTVSSLKNDNNDDDGGGKMEVQSADDQLSQQAAEVSALRGIYRDLIETIPALNELNSAMDSLSASVYAGWRDIQLLRRSNSDICNTGAVLSVRKVNSNLAAPGGEGDAGQFWETFRASLLDVPRLVEAAQTILFRAADNNSKTAKGREDEAAAAVLNRQDSPRGSEFSAPQLALKASDEQLDRQVALARTVSAIRESVQTLVDSNGLIPQYALRLTEGGAITPDHQLPALEAKRRACLRGIRLKAVLKINGSTVTATEHRPLLSMSRMSCCCEFNQFFEFRVFFQPRDVSLDLYSRCSDSWAAADVFLANIAIPFPGQCLLRPSSSLGGLAGQATSNHKVVAHSYSPSSGWYSFSSDTPSVPRRAMRDMGFTEEELAMPQRTEGSMLCTAEYDMGTVEARSPYDPIQPGEVTLLPPATTLHKQSLLLAGLSNSSGGGGDAAIRAYDFTRENDFQSLLPDLDDIDVNDPLNDHLLYLKSKRGHVSSSSNQPREVFRLVGGDYASSFSSEGGFSFANYVRFKETPRMKLLQLRSLKPHLFQQPIPLNEAQIKSDAFYKNIFLKEIHEKMARLGNSEIAADEYDPTESAATTAPGTSKGRGSINAPKIAPFLQRVRSSQTASSRQKKKPHFATPSVVVETDYLQFEEAQLGDCFGRLRRLHPKPKYREAASIQVDKCELLVQIVGAKNIPLRAEEESIQSQLLTASRTGAAAAAMEGRLQLDEQQPLVSEHLLDERKRKDKLRARTFVEVRFQEHSATTSTLDGGSCPMWRQSVSLPFHAPQDDYSPSSLQQVRDVVHFSLFDEVLEDDSERGGFLEGESTSRVEKRFIGSFCMPFETVYREGRIEGVFRVDTPTINFGYDHAASSLTAGADNSSGMFVGSSSSNDDSAPAAPNNDHHRPDDMLYMAQTGLLGALDCFLQCLVSSNVKKPQEYDSLYSSSSSFIHRRTQSEFAYYAMDDSITYLKVMITLDPILVTAPSVPDEVTLSSVRREDRDISLYARKWLLGVRALNHVTAHRQYKLFGADSQGCHVFVGRYLTPQRPPAGFESRRSCVHLVSSIPFMKDGQSFVGIFDLWCNSKEFWEIGAGDEEEHAVQLFNYLYFLSLRKRTGLEDSSNTSSSDILRESVFLVLGKAVPEGASVYVMLRDDARSDAADPWRADNFLLINPCTGFMYSAMDPNGPIRDIQVLFTPSNAWANLQVVERPAQLSFDLLDPSCWRPFFGHRLPLPPGGLTPIQPAVEYVETSPGYALEVEKSLTQTIRNTVRRWRSRRHRSTTAFHQGACDAISDLLPKLEQWKRSGGGGGGLGGGTADSSSSASEQATKDDNYGALIELQRLTQDKLRQMLKTRTLRGFPINMPFTDEDEIVTKIKASCVHEIKHPDVQFVLSVRAFPLYNNIISLWVFLGTLEPVRS